MTTEEAKQVAALLQGVLAACDELMTEFVSKKRAANWGVINTGMYEAERAVRALTAEVKL